MKKTIIAIALTSSVAACGNGASVDKGPAEEDMKAAASKLLELREAEIAEFTKGKCRAKDKGYVCKFEMTIAYGESPTKLDLNSGYFFKSGDDEWVMELES